MYEKTHFKADLVGGIFNGVIFSSCWGFVNGSYFCYKPEIKPRIYLKDMLKYTRNSIFFLTPLFVVARITNNYCRDSGFSPEKASLATFGVCLIILIAFKNKINI